MAKMTIWGMIDAQPIVFPAVAEHVNGASLQFTVPADAARPLLPGDAFELVEPEPGAASVVMSAFEIREGEWGPSNLFDVGLWVRPVGVPDAAAGLFLSPAPMSPTFGRETAHRALGFPKLEGTIDAVYTDETVTFRVGNAGVSDVVLRFPRVPADAPAVPVSMVFYTYVGGAPYAVPFEIDLLPGIVDPQRVEIELGSGPLSDVLRRLGFPRAPRVAVCGERLSAAFDLPAPVAAAADASLDGDEVADTADTAEVPVGTDAHLPSSSR